MTSPRVSNPANATFRPKVSIQIRDGRDTGVPLRHAASGRSPAGGPDRLDLLASEPGPEAEECGPAPPRKSPHPHEPRSRLRLWGGACAAT